MVLTHNKSFKLTYFSLILFVQSLSLLLAQKEAKKNTQLNSNVRLRNQMSIKQFKKDQAVVSISRDSLDPNRIQGVILGYSKELLLINYIYDFKLDGLMILRRRDISKIESSKTDKFQKKLLIKEGVFDDVDFKANYKLGSWHELFKDASKRHKYFIIELEDQNDPDFYIGRIERINSKSIRFNYFTGIARWIDEPCTLKLDSITSCQIKSNYLNVYERYFNGLSD